jgi:hypothetical protein
LIKKKIVKKKKIKIEKPVEVPKVKVELSQELTRLNTAKKVIHYDTNVPEGWKIVCECNHDSGDPIKLAKQCIKEYQQKYPKDNFKIQRAHPYLTYILKEIKNKGKSNGKK